MYFRQELLKGMPPPRADEVVWQDREVRFDSPPAEMQCRKGEVVVDSINSVEDTKGNNGERGVRHTAVHGARYILIQVAVDSFRASVRPTQFSQRLDSAECTAVSVHGEQDITVRCTVGATLQSLCCSLSDIQERRAGATKKHLVLQSTGTCVLQQYCCSAVPH